MAAPTYKIVSINSSGTIAIKIKQEDNVGGYYRPYIRYEGQNSNNLFIGGKNDGSDWLTNFGTGTEISLTLTHSNLANGGQFIFNLGYKKNEDDDEQKVGATEFSTALLEFYNESTLFKSSFYTAIGSLTPTITIISDIPTRKNYKFNGKWRVQEGSTEKVGISYTKGNGVWSGGYYKLLAEWTKLNTLTLDYDANKGVFSNGESTYQDYHESETATSFSITIYEKPTREGYIFINWKVISGPDKINNEYNPGAKGYWSASDTPYKLQAQWEEIPTYKIKIVYSANGGSWSNGKTQKTYEASSETNSTFKFTTESAPENPPSDGKIFAYWQRTSDNATFEAGVSGEWSGSYDTTTYNLKAIWKDKSKSAYIYINKVAYIPYVYMDGKWNPVIPYINKVEYSG